MPKEITGKTINVDQLQAGFRKYPIDDHGKLRFQAGKVSALTEAVAQNGTIGACWLPPGRKRIIPHLSRITTSAFGAARTLSMGHDAYNKRPSGQGSTAETVEAANPTALINAMDVSAAVNAAVFSTVLTYDMFSIEEQLLFFTVGGGTMPIGATLQFLLAYLYE